MRTLTARRIMRGLSVGFVLLLGLVVAALIFFRTGFGRERLRHLLVSRLNGEIHGRISIGSLGGNLPGEVVLHDVVLSDSAGSPILGIERVMARIHVLELFSKRIDISEMTFEQPVLVLRHARGGGWNVARVFARPDQGGARNGGNGSGFGHWVRIRNARVIGGDVTVRVPWTADSGLAPAQRDSARVAALAGETRARVERTRNGLEQVMTFHRIDADLPRVLLAHPDSARIVVDVAKARMVAEPFRPPAADVRDLGGVLAITSDSLHFAGWRVVFPETRMAVDLRYAPGTGGLHASLRAEPLVLDDLRWLHPALPPEGRGAVALEASRERNGSDLDIRATRIALHSGATEVTGTLGITLGDTTRLHDTELRIDQLDTRLVERLAPHVTLPVSGVVDARARLEGPVTALETDARIAVRERSGATSVVSARGILQIEPAVGARRLRVELEPLQTSLVRSAAAAFPLRGVLTGALTVNGTSSTGWRFDGDVSHVDRGVRSRLIGWGSVASGARAFAADARLAPLSLAAAGQASSAAKDFGLHGMVTGTVRASGTRDSASFRSSLRLADGGMLDANGYAEWSTGDLAYAVTAHPVALDPRVLSTRLPAGALTGTISARGSGTDPRTMQAELLATLGRARVEDAEVDSMQLRARVADGVAAIDTLAAWVPATRLAASGSIGLVAERRGELRYALQVDSLEPLLRLARSVGNDSTTGRSATDSVSGGVTANGVLRGNLKALRTEGHAAMRATRAGTVSFAKGTLDYTADLRGGDTLAVTAMIDSALVRRLTYEHAELRFDGSRRGGAADVAVHQRDGVDYRIRADVARDDAGAGWDEGPGTTVLLRELTLRLDSAAWTAVQPATLAWHTGTLRIDSLRMRRGGGAGGALAVNGVLPFAGDGALTLELTAAPLRDVGVLLQSELGIDGRASLEARVAGTTAAPRATVEAGLTRLVVGSDTMPDVRASLSYARATLTGRAELGASAAPPLLRADATLPVNLALTGVTGPRLANDAPLRVDARADSVPLVLLPRRDQVQVLGGWARGQVAVRGTVAEPNAIGHLDVRDASARVTQTGTLLHHVIASARLVPDSVVLDSLVGVANGSVRAAGSVTVARDAPHRVSATVTARDVAVLDGPQGVMHADAAVTASGTMDSVLVTGRAELLHGYLERKGPGEQTLHVMATGDPELFAIIDTSAAARRSSEPPRASPTRTVRLDLAVRIDSGVWYRTPPNANVEVATAHDVRVRGDLASGDLANGGIVLTKGGIYVFRLRPFSIVRGAAILAGVTDVAPALELTGEHEVWIAGRGVLPVRITVAGFPGDVRFALGDASTLPAAPADLTSYLALGRSPLSLLQHEGSSVSGLSTNGTRLTGALGALTRRQQVSPALGAILYQFAKGAHDVAGVRLYTAAPTDLPPELSESRYAGVRGTTVEAGYLLGTRSYLAARLRLAAVAPGVVFSHTFESGLRVRAGYEPRFLLGEPTLGRTQQGLIRGSLGAFLAREWGF